MDVPSKKGIISENESHGNERIFICSQRRY
ncbi:hypothetical protein PHET_09641 [Paragonimus heterotremus]|uniref:Uncharacterized protein n=1 Tax=Paragonimus heterotremus TaxID=100268 RepID=A0A8J4WUF7_9TREM|nr:hypothetical protein PHET_09641 [Paragonimus heterotremus]